MLKQFGVDQNGRFGLLKSCLLFCTIAKRFHLFLSDKHQAAGAWDLLHGEDLCAIFPHWNIGMEYYEVAIERKSVFPKQLR